MKKYLLAGLLALLTFAAGILCGRALGRDPVLADLGESSHRLIHGTITELRPGSQTVSAEFYEMPGYPGGPVPASFAAKDARLVDAAYREIGYSDLSVGDQILVTFSGGALETYPLQLLNVSRVVRLDG